MAILEKNLRAILKNSVIRAREVAESAATSITATYAVTKSDPYQYMNGEERELRNELRSHGRQLGDKRNGDGTQSVSHLVEEIAYQHWHQMLFSRFLAENNLLIHPTEKVSVSLADCEELASEEGYVNSWDCAASYASKMLPQIFRTDSPLISLKFPSARQIELEAILRDLPCDVFHASDSLGWCYQYWQDKQKKAINASEVKIGADELSAVTQLFTEPYMVAFLLDNALGAWFAKRRLTEQDFREARDEEELRKKASISGVPLLYLRFFRDVDTGNWRIASNTLDNWPNDLSELKILDPCCGSGHFIVSVFNMLVPIRMYLESLPADEAIKKVIKQNIYGLELDERCVEIAAFALAFAAWTFPGAEGYKELPQMHIACCGKSINIDTVTWNKLVAENPQCSEGLKALYEEFKNAPSLGSLMDPIARLNEMTLFGSFEETRPVFQRLIKSADTDNREVGITAFGVSEAAEILSQKYHWITTNPPYLGIGQLDDDMKTWIQKNYPDSKSNLGTVFIERCLSLNNDSGICSMVVPNQWTFLGSYKKMRQKLLKQWLILHIGDLGSGAFEEITGEIVKVILLGIAKEKRDNNDFPIICCNQEKESRQKAEGLKHLSIQFLSQKKQLSNPDSRIVFSPISTKLYLSTIVNAYAGILNGDSPRFIQNWWETEISYPEWVFLQTTVSNTTFWGGLLYKIRFDFEKGHLRQLPEIRKVCLHNSDQRGNQAWRKPGIVINEMGDLCCSLYGTYPFDSNIAVIPCSEILRTMIWCYCSSPEYSQNVRKIDQKLNVTNATLVKVPFEKERWMKVAGEKYPNGLPLPFTDDPTQWIFHGHPCASVVWDEGVKGTKESDNRIDDTVLQVAVARLLGYHWPAELDETMELAKEQRTVVERVQKEFSGIDDMDGIVCIPAFGKERPASDRLLDVLAIAYGKEWSNSILNQLLGLVGFNGKSLEDWLRNGFFKQHCKLFGERPFIWQIWDGLPDGFSVLVNYHKFGKKNLEKLIYSVLSDWIRAQESGKGFGVEGAEQRIDAANALKTKLIAILEGESPLDIFVRWKRLEEQPIGWNPDLDDGVRLNIRPFLTVDAVKTQGCGVLRERPNVKWGLDRGKDVETSPWYSVFQGKRNNEYHLTLAEKRGSK